MFKDLQVISGPIHKGKFFTFEKGETAIVGPNGCGKSLLAEYMAFLLFGAVALRGKVADYKNLSVEGTVEIKNKVYHIFRDTKNCVLTMCNTLNADPIVICTGTKACNLKIITLLGYDYNVYKMGNYAEQLDILGLGKMKPAERKSALDKTLGIGVVDKLVKYTNDKALQYKHEAEGLKFAIVDPGEEPSRPNNYGESQGLATAYQNQQKRIEDYNLFCTKVKPVEPIKPIKPEGLENWNLLALSQAVTERATLEQRLTEYKKVPTPVYTDATEYDKLLDQWKLYHEYEHYLDKVKFLELDKDPVLDMDTVLEYENLLNEWDIYNAKLKSYNLGKVKCPKCGEEFNPYSEAPQQPKAFTNWSRKDLMDEKERIQKKQKLAEIPVMDPVEKPAFDMATLVAMRANFVQYSEAMQKIPEIEEQLKDYEGATQENLQKLQKYDTDLELYDHLMAIYRESLASYNKLAEEFKDFDEDKENDRLAELARAYNASVQYERDLKDYQAKKAEFDRLVEKMTDLALQEQRYKKAVDNLKEMKLKIKGYVLPSLQKVASILLSEMSDGLFTDVKIDPEFNILVENREVNLFSGSEQAMINLALRLGLGQVLTHKAFSVFVGDEIDASMRDERAQLTANCLRKISKYIKQVILISHRDIEADHYINLNGEK
jgi:DNA repair exonuclease SbcCD ATPase subunit